MAVFERKKEDKIIIDDTKPLMLEITGTQNVDTYIEYIIEVCRYPDIEEKWTVSHRFSDFACLHSSLKTPTIQLPSIPPKKVFGNTDKDFINERKSSLQEYLKKLSENYFVSITPQFRKFVDPNNYSEKFSEEAHQNLLVSLRSTGSHSITQLLPKIGTRIRKKYFLGSPLSDPKSQHLLWWAPYGPDRVKHLKDVHSTLTALLHCQHTCIVSAVSCIATESGVCVIRPFFPQGSLRDYIYGVKPQFDFLLKYTNNKRRQIPIKTCAAYGRQILEALLFLHEKGIAHGCLHTGNVVIVDNVCKLLDLENQVVGLPHPLRRFMTKIKKVNSLEAVDIYAFGHLLYEMVFSEPLISECCDHFPVDTSPLCRSVLESILSTEACRNGLPSASALLTHLFFNEVPLRSYEKPFLKLSSGVKQSLYSTYEASLGRLKEDRKKVKLQRQKYRAEAVLSGEAWPPKSSKKNSKADDLRDRNSIDPAVKDIDSKMNDSPIPDSGLHSTGPICADSISNDSLSETGSMAKEGKSLVQNSVSPGRSLFLDSISSFDKSNLKKRNPNPAAS